MARAVALKTVRNAPARGGPVRVAAYVRASTEGQQYSTQNQSEGIRAYAAQRGMVVVRTYADEGQSGLTIRRRRALKQLIEDVVAQRADFTEVLVYDVSRWGRFQDADESAYYEFICQRAGIRIHFCAEQFSNDDNIYSAIIKSLKRAMAGEYSRELGVKVFAAHARFVRLGYAQGGPSGYGLRRLLVDRDGSPRGELRAGETKSIATDRVVLVPGPPAEVATVRWIFEAFVHERRNKTQIALDLNQRGIPATRHRAWTQYSVARVLGCERFVGNYVWNRRSSRLDSKSVRNTPDKWVRAEGVIDPIVCKSLFLDAQEIIRARNCRRTQEQKLEPLRRLWRENGFVSLSLIRRSANVPSFSSYRRWFGGLKRAYELIGYRPCRPYRRMLRNGQKLAYNLTNEDLLELLRRPLRDHGYISCKIIDETEGLPCASTYIDRFGCMKRIYQLLAEFPEHPGNRPPVERKYRSSVLTNHLSDDQLLSWLKDLLGKRGFLTKHLIDASKGLPCADTYVTRFGSMTRIYQLIGYDAKHGRRRQSKKWSEVHRN
jgi:DNA invertase Pin-like site-specific DNA recombinase